MNYDLSILFWLFKAKKTKGGLCPIWVRLTINNKRSELSLGRKILSEDWNEKIGQVKGKSKQVKIINNYLATVKGELNHQYNILSSNYSEVTLEMIKNTFLGLPAIALIAETENTLLSSVDYVLAKFTEKVNQSNRSGGTLKGWYSLRKKLIHFMQYAYQKPDMLLKDIKFSFAEDFLDYLMLVDPNRLEESSAMKLCQKY